MDKLKMESLDMTQVNIEKIEVLFPSVITEAKDENGKLKKAINFELLKQILSDEVLDGDEAYEFTWVGKKAAIVEGNKPIRKTLRPCKEESKNWDTTENLYIEGDNLDVLKLLQESYLGQVKMIYIDPPYNTGKDFIYKDNFAMSKEDYNEEQGIYDEDENRLFQNNESNGRFHSDWCSMIYPRLHLARSLLTDDGVIFISIDDNEVENLKKVCSEVFGGVNFICQFTRKGSGGRQDSKHFAIVHEYILCYTKSYECFVSGKEIKEDDNYPSYDELKNLRYKTQLLRKWGENSKRSDRPNLFYPIPDPDGNDNYPMLSDVDEGCWRWGKEKMFEEIKNGKVEFKKKVSEWIAYEKIFEPNEDDPNTKLYTTIIDGIGNSTGASLLKELFNGKVFNYPKPVELIKKIIQFSNAQNNDIILDFFSGSATTAHAVMQLNAEDNAKQVGTGNRKFIMVQLPEETDEKSEAYKAGYKNICEIGKERIRRAGEKIKEEFKIGNAFEVTGQECMYKDDIEKIGGETVKNLDTGFRVLKLDSTNMKDVYYAAEEYDQTMLSMLESNIKDDRTDIDLLYGCLLEWGLPLSLSHKSEEIDGVTVHTYNDGDLIACFENKVSVSVIKEIANRKPLRAVFRDSSFASSPEKINVEEIFKLTSPNTSVKVI